MSSPCKRREQKCYLLLKMSLLSLGLALLADLAIDLNFGRNGAGVNAAKKWQFREYIRHCFDWLAEAGSGSGPYKSCDCAAGFGDIVEVGSSARLCIKML